MSAEVGTNRYEQVKAVPSLEFVFTGLKKSMTDRISGKDLITFTRTTVGTYVDENGVIQTADINEPRFDYDPETGESLGLLVEESRTNLVTYSENFNLWGAVYRTTISPNAAISPSGQLNATKFNVTTDTGYHARSLSITGGTYTVSIFAKAGEYSGIQITGTNTDQDHTSFNLVNGTAYYAGTNVTDEKIENFGNGWYRCSARLPLTNGNFFVAITDGISTSWLPSFAGSSATDGIYIWGAQIEAGSFPTSYIPTDGTPGGIVRGPDLASITGTNFSSWYNQTEGSWYIDYNKKLAPVNIANVGVIGPQHLYYRGNSSEALRRFGSNTSATGAADNQNKISLAYGSSDFDICANGNATVNNYSVATPTGQTTAHIMSDGSNYLTSHISRLTYWPVRLADTYLQELTQ